MVEVTRPVENPDLVARLLGLRSSQQSAADVVTLQMMRDARYLLATQIAHPDGGPPVVDGMMRAGTRINLYTIRSPDGSTALAAFTDWPSLRAAVGNGDEWNGLIQSGEDLFRLGISTDYPGGVVINPSGPEVAFEMRPALIELMYGHAVGSSDQQP